MDIISANYSESSDPDRESSRRSEGDRSEDVPEGSDDQEWELGRSGRSQVTHVTHLTASSIL
jgi:hypothetical protein